MAMLNENCVGSITFKTILNRNILPVTLLELLVAIPVGVYFKWELAATSYMGRYHTVKMTKGNAKRELRRFNYFQDYLKPQHIARYPSRIVGGNHSWSIF
jgi:hypothetical protein